MMIPFRGDAVRGDDAALSDVDANTSVSATTDEAAATRVEPAPKANLGKPVSLQPTLSFLRKRKAMAAKLAAEADEAFNAALENESCTTRKTPAGDDDQLELSLRSAACDLLTSNAATAFCTSKRAVELQYTNLSILSALFLTIINMSPVEELGPQLFDEGTMFRLHVYASTTTSAFFLVSALGSSFIVMQSSVAHSDAEIMLWVANCQMQFKIAYATFMLGLFSVLALEAFQFLSWEGLALSSIAFLAALYGLIFTFVYSVTHGLAGIKAIRDRRLHKGLVHDSSVPASHRAPMW